MDRKSVRSKGKRKVEVLLIFQMDCADIRYHGNLNYGQFCGSCGHYPDSATEMTPTGTNCRSQTFLSSRVLSLVSYKTSKHRTATAQSALTTHPPLNPIPFVLNEHNDGPRSSTGIDHPLIKPMCLVLSRHLSRSTSNQGFTQYCDMA